MKYPNRIRELRELARLTQRELAMRVGMSGSEIHKIETGARKLTQAHIATFAKFFGVTSDYLMDSEVRPTSAGTTKGQLPIITTGIERLEQQMEEVKRQLEEIRANIALLLKTLLGSE